MTEAELELNLRHWGRAVAGAVSRTDLRGIGPSSYGTNPIATGMEFALGSRSAVIRSLTNMDRSGNSRRRIMGKGAGVESMRSVPKWACEPAAGTETKGGFGAPKEDPRFTPKVERIQGAVMTLYRLDPLRGACVICQYQLYGMTQAEKAVEVGKRLTINLGVRQYREELKIAKFGLLISLNA